MRSKQINLAFVYNLKQSDAPEEAEFDTEETVAQIAQGLSDSKPLGYSINLKKIQMDKDEKWIAELLSFDPDLIFNTTEGFRGIGRESYAPIVFEQLGLPFVGSNAYASFLTLNKELCKQIVGAAGVPVSPGYLITELEILQNLSKSMEFPVFAKPNFEGSSKGIGKDSYCNNLSDLEKYWKKYAHQFPEGILVERYLPGKDVTVPFISGLGDEGVLEVVEYSGPLSSDGHWIYDYALKNEEDDVVKVHCPAALKDHTRRKVMESMKKVVKSLGINDLARADFRIGPNEEVTFIEINPLPSLQADAGIFEATKQIGLNYEQSLEKVLESALGRYDFTKETSASYKAPRPKFLEPRRTAAKVALVFNQKRKKPGEAGYEDEAEFDSDQTIQSIAKAIEANGYKPELIEAQQDVAEKLKQAQVDVVFNIAEGSNKRGREAQIPAICDFLGIEHTGSDATTLAICLDKDLCNRIVESAGIRVPQSMILKSMKSLPKELPLKFPIIAKPNLEGTSKGIYDHSVATNKEELNALLEELFSKFSTPILCQEYIVGREFTIGLLGSNARPDVLKPLEIVFKEKSGRFPVYSYEKKLLDEQMDNEFLSLHCPPELSKEQWKTIKNFAKKVYKTLDCRDLSRIDFKLTDNNEAVFIEINPLPGLSPGYSDLSIMSEKQGMAYEKLIGKVLRPAIRRWKKEKSRFLK